MSQKRSFTRELKLAAVKRVVEQGFAFREVAEDLGIGDSAVRAWKRGFQYNGTLENQIVQKTSVKAELKRLREENRQLKMGTVSNATKLSRKAFLEETLQE